MIKQIQDLHERKDSLEKRIAKNEETIKAGIFTSPIEKEAAKAELNKDKENLESVLTELHNLATL